MIIEKELALVIVHEHVSDVNMEHGYYCDNHLKLYNNNSNLI